MRASIQYDTFKEYGVYDEDSYKVRIEESSGRTNIHFLFPNKTRGLSPNSFITEMAISFTREEAVDVAAALSGFLHHLKLEIRS